MFIIFTNMIVPSGIWNYFTPLLWPVILIYGTVYLLEMSGIFGLSKVECK